MAKQTRQRIGRASAAKRPPGRQPTPDIVHTSAYLPRPVYLALREIALDLEKRGQRVKIHDLLMEGVDAVLKRYGKPTVAELKNEV
jgi:hypothetical protein